jgi:hypothetical protein
MAVPNVPIVSSDSHVMEPVDLWKKGVPEKYRADALLFPPHKVGEGFQHHAGGWDPYARIKESFAPWYGPRADRQSCQGPKSKPNSDWNTRPDWPFQLLMGA